MNVEHSNRCPDCGRPVGTVDSGKPKVVRFCWVRNGAVCMQTQLAHQKALNAPLLRVLVQARRVIAAPVHMPQNGEFVTSLFNLAHEVIELDNLEPVAPEATAAE